MLDLFAAPVLPRLSIEGDIQHFPVRRVWCVGQNYADHAREMGSDPERQPPFFFAKQPDSVVANGGLIAYPPQTENFHYEGELVVAIGRGGAGIAAAQALDHVFGYGCGIDFTRRDLQAKLKAGGKPWELAKAFDQAAPVGALTPRAKAGAIDQAVLTLKVDGVIKQQGSVGTMIWSIAEIIAALSASVTLAPGDLIFTGTPAGVGPVTIGQTVDVSVTGLTPLRVTIGA